MRDITFKVDGYFIETYRVDNDGSYVHLIRGSNSILWSFGPDKFLNTLIYDPHGALAGME